VHLFLFTCSDLYITCLGSVCREWNKIGSCGATLFTGNGILGSLSVSVSLVYAYSVIRLSEKKANGIVLNARRPCTFLSRTIRPHHRHRTSMLRNMGLHIPFCSRQDEGTRYASADLCLPTVDKLTTPTRVHGNETIVAKLEGNRRYMTTIHKPGSKLATLPS
jgi:hypothetical protein